MRRAFQNWLKASIRVSTSLNYIVLGKTSAKINKINKIVFNHHDVYIWEMITTVKI